MTNLFKKAAVFTDLHIGLKSNSAAHLADCDEFIDWMIETALAEGCSTCIFCGDFHHNRSSINIVALTHSLRALEKLNDAFDDVFFLPGNHDLYFKDRRDVMSAVWAKHIPNIHVISDILSVDDVTFVPWLIGDDYKTIRRIKTKYVFGHFELPHFFMNAMIKMPDSGNLKSEDFSEVDMVFTGHFHRRQQQNNITYLGNAFPHNYADKDDDERGFMILEWGEQPRFFNWPNAPRYRVYNLSDLAEDPDGMLLPKMCVRVNLDLPISYEEANFIKESFADAYDLREISLLPQKQSLESTEITTVAFESVDQIVQTELSNITSKEFDQHLLMEIYRNL